MKDVSQIFVCQIIMLNCCAMKYVCQLLKKGGRKLFHGKSFVRKGLGEDFCVGETCRF